MLSHPFGVNSQGRWLGYFFQGLPRHALLQAEGAWVESFYPGVEAIGTLQWQDRLALAQILGKSGRIAVESLANEAILYKRHTAKTPEQKEAIEKLSLKIPTEILEVAIRNILRLQHSTLLRG